MSSQPRTSKWLKGNPEWEAMKASSRLLGHHEATMECEALSEQYRVWWKPHTAGKMDILKILQLLREKRIAFVLTGAHGFASWTGRPRATQDVDILVKSGRDYARTINALRVAHPQLKVCQFTGITGFFWPGERRSLIDVAYPFRPDLVETLRTAIWVEGDGLRYRVPAREAAMANKYGASLTKIRDVGDRALDVVDFMWIVKHAARADRPPLDLARLRDLGKKVWSGGAAGIVRLVEDTLEGKMPDLNQPARL